MNLNRELAQKIVQETMEVLGKNINIMDQKGIIIASGDQSRVDDFHEAAAEVIEKGEIINNTAAEAEHYQGTKQGINLPIKFNDEIIGVVGITGQVNEVAGYGKIVKNMAELILKQEMLFEEINRKNKVRENFYQQLLGDYIENKELLKDRANLLNIKYKSCRIVIIIRLDSIDKERIIKKMQYLFNNLQQEEEILLIRGENLVLIKSMMSNQKEEQEQEIKEIVSKIKRGIKEKNFIIGIGEVFKKLDKLYSSYQGAKRALEVGDTVYAQEQKVFYLNRLGYDYFLPLIPEEAVDYYLHNLFNNNLVHLFSESELGDIIEALVNNDLNISQTAQELYMHRNTLLYKLERVEEKTGINPKEAQGLFMLLFAHHLYLYKY